MRRIVDLRDRTTVNWCAALQAKLEGICVGIETTAKLAFTNEHQKKLFHEWSVYMDLESRGIIGILPILGIFHQTGEKGPSCLLLQHFGTSIVERPTLITPKQWCICFLSPQPQY
jgi:hypothetical protein